MSSIIGAAGGRFPRLWRDPLHVAQSQAVEALVRGGAGTAKLERQLLGQFRAVRSQNIQAQRLAPRETLGLRSDPAVLGDKLKQRRILILLCLAERAKRPFQVGTDLARRRL
jgi:hypothetical protein